MSKAVLISIKPKWCELIASGKKTVEVRKTRPKMLAPFTVYIYETRGNERFGNETYNSVKKWNGRGMVIGQFVCNMILPISIGCNKPEELTPCEVPGYGLTDIEIMDYLGNGETGYAWYISELQIYDKPKELREITKCRYEYCKGWCGRALSVLCNCQQTTYFKEKENPPKLDLNIVKCRKKDKRPPQSWCYVEELDGN